MYGATPLPPSSSLPSSSKTIIQPKTGLWLEEDDDDESLVSSTPLLSRKSPWRRRSWFLALLGMILLIWQWTVTNWRDATTRSNFKKNKTTTTTTSQSTVSVTPVIGIFSQPRHHRHRRTGQSQQQEQQFYIAASYVKWLEAGGARTIAIPYDAPVPVPTNQTNNTTDDFLLDDILNQVHAIFLPGGATVMSPAIQYVLDKVVDLNLRPDDNIVFPVWGTCLGFEFLLQYIGNGGANTQYHPSQMTREILQSGFDAENISLPLQHVVASHKDSLYTPPHIHEIVTTHNTTLNNHVMGITPQAFLSNPNLTAIWDITSTNIDRKGRPFVSTIEPKLRKRDERPILPFYGVQYHPEKNAFEYAFYPGTTIPYEVIDHSPSGIEFSMYLARRVVALARQNLHARYVDPHRFPMISSSHYPIIPGTTFEQIYLIPSASNWTS